MKNRLLVTLLAAVFLLLIMAAPVLDVPVSSHDTAQLNFKTKTVAICEEKSGYIQCHDELVVNCGNEEYILPKEEKTVNCDGIALQVPSITAFAVFDEDWQDPRYLAE